MNFIYFISTRVSDFLRVSHICLTVKNLWLDAIDLENRDISDLIFQDRVNERE